jgi:hypothetical protein
MVGAPRAAIPEMLVRHVVALREVVMWITGVIA